MTRAEDHLVVSGATDTQDWPEAKPLGIPMDWAWRALAPGLQAVGRGGGEGAEDGVRCTVLTPENTPLPRCAATGRAGRSG